MCVCREEWGIHAKVECVDVRWCLWECACMLVWYLFLHFIHSHTCVCSEGLKNAELLREVREQLDEEKKSRVSILMVCVPHKVLSVCSPWQQTRGMTAPSPPSGAAWSADERDGVQKRPIH